MEKKTIDCKFIHAEHGFDKDLMDENGEPFPILHIKIMEELYDEEDREEEEIGYANVTMLNLRVLRLTDFCDIFDACDAESDDMLEMAENLFDHRFKYTLKQGILKDLGIPWPFCQDYDLALVSRIIIHEKFRGSENILKDLFQHMRFHLGQKVIIAGTPLPLQYEGTYEGCAYEKVVNMDELDEKRFKDMDYKTALKKIRKHYIECGLIPSKTAKDYLFLVSDNPNKVLDNWLNHD